VDWPTIASLATAFGTLVLAIATFASVRSANRAARTAERSLLAGIRPLLLAARLQDPPQKVTWQDQHFVHLDGGRATAESVDGNLYLAAAVRNAGSGLAVLWGWYPYVGLRPGSNDHARPDEFRRLTRDLYIAPGDTGFWQGAVRQYEDPFHEPLRVGIEQHEPLTIDVMYGDQEGGQRIVTRFALTPLHDGGYLLVTGRHWNLDRADPR
jgi:hypothetical protein